MVGFTFDERLNWGAMVGALAKKARTRVEARTRVGRDKSSFSVTVQQVLRRLYVGKASPVLDTSRQLKRLEENNKEM